MNKYIEKLVVGKYKSPSVVTTKYITVHYEEPLSVLKVQKGFTRPFIFKNTEVLPVLKGLCKILVN